jgi:hypothetical protein
MLERFLVGTFSDADRMVNAVAPLRAAGVSIHDLFTPYPVHGLDQALGLRRTRLPLVTLLMGAVGLGFAIVFQYYTAVFDWPLDVGGKPDNVTLAFVPISFELTVLIGGLATVGVFLLRTRLYPGKREQLPVHGVTNNVFAIVVHAPSEGDSESRVRQIFKDGGAETIEELEGEL